MDIIEQIERAAAKAQREAEALRDAREADRRAPKAKNRATKIRRLEEAERSARCDVRVAKAARAEQARCAKKGGSKASNARPRRPAAPPAPPREPLALISGPPPIGLLPPPLPRLKVAKVKKTAGRRLAATAKQRAARAASRPKPIATRGRAEMIPAMAAAYVASLGPEFSLEELQKYYRVVRHVPGSSTRSAISFIDRRTGEIFKAANWKRPRKRGTGVALQSLKNNTLPTERGGTMPESAALALRSPGRKDVQVGDVVMRTAEFLRATKVPPTDPMWREHGEVVAVGKPTNKHVQIRWDEEPEHVVSALRSTVGIAKRPGDAPRAGVPMANLPLEHAALHNIGQSPIRKDFNVESGGLAKTASGPRAAQRSTKTSGRATSAAEPRRGTFNIKTSDGFAERTGYVLGYWATHKEPGKGQYFWGITHLPTGYKVTASPVLEDKTQALARLVEYHTKGPPDVQAGIIKDIQAEAAELEAEREKARKIAAQVGDVGGRVAVLGRIRRGRKKSWGVRFQVLPMHVEHLDRDEFFHPVEAFPPPAAAAAPTLLPPPLARRKVAQVRKAPGGRLRALPKARAVVKAKRSKAHAAKRFRAQIMALLPVLRAIPDIAGLPGAKYAASLEEIAKNGDARSAVMLIKNVGLDNAEADKIYRKAHAAGAAYFKAVGEELPDASQGPAQSGTAEALTTARIEASPTVDHVEWSDSNDMPKVYVRPWISGHGLEGSALVNWPAHDHHPMVVFVGPSGTIQRLRNGDRERALKIALPSIVSAIKNQYLSENKPTRARELYTRLRRASALAGIDVSVPKPKSKPRAEEPIRSTPEAPIVEPRASAVVSDFEERRSRRAERLSERAGRLAREGAAKVERAREMAGVIPFGQPIHVGHHSEHRDRRFREKIHETFRAGYETTKAAEEIARRAGAAAENRAISSDDPAAIEKLKAKLAAEEAEHALHVKGNAIIRKHGKDVEGAARAMLALGIKPSQVQRAMMTFGNSETPSGFFTQNSAANIRRIKERIKELTQHRTAPATGPETIGEIEIFEEDNRTKLRFPGKPSAEIRERLKSAGFRWSPTTSTWQRMSSSQALYYAREIARAASPAVSGPLRQQTGPEDHEGAGRERYWDQTKEQRQGALKTMVDDAGLKLDQHDPSYWPALESRRAFARGWLDEHHRATRKQEK